MVNILLIHIKRRETMNNYITNNFEQVDSKYVFHNDRKQEMCINSMAEQMAKLISNQIRV